MIVETLEVEMTICSFAVLLPSRVKTVLRRYIKTPVVAKAFGRCGRNLHLGADVVFDGIENIYVGDNVYIGGRNILKIPP